MFHSFDDLLRMQDESDIRLVNLEIDLGEYRSEWDELLRAFGYTQAQYEFNIDQRWDWLFSGERFPDVFTNLVWSLQSCGLPGAGSCYIDQHAGA